MRTKSVPRTLLDRPALSADTYRPSALPFTPLADRLRTSVRRRRWLHRGLPILATIQVQGATIIIGNPDLVPFLLGKTAHQVRDAALNPVPHSAASPEP